MGAVIPLFAVCLAVAAAVWAWPPLVSAIGVVVALAWTWLLAPPVPHSELLLLLLWRLLAEGPVLVVVLVGVPVVAAVAADAAAASWRLLWEWLGSHLLP